MRLNKKQWLVIQLMALLLIAGGFLALRPHLARAVGVNPNLVGAPMSGRGLSGDPYIITTCEQLQDVGITGYFEEYILANDIDCSATASWNSGAGFIPIASNSSFTGGLDGRGHTIQNIVINSTDNQGHTGLFAQTNLASINNFSLVNASITGNGKDDNGNPGTGGIIGTAQRTYINRVSFEGSVTHTNCSLSPNVGGIIGRAYTDSGNVALSQVSSRGTITVNGTNCGDYTAAVGGVIGVTQTFNSHGVDLYNPYSTMDITLNGNQQVACTDGHCRSAGGIIGSMRGYDMSRMITGYSAGSITITDNDTQQEYRVGGVIGTQFAPIDLSSVFDAATITLPNTCDIDTCASNQRYYGALVGTTGTANENIIGNFWYDADIAPNDSCRDNNASAECNAYNVGGSDPSFMKGNTTNGAMGGFDFTTIWQVVANDYPVLLDTQPAYPGTITDLSTNVLSESAIEVSWTPVNTPSELFDQAVLCKKSSETSWQFCKGDIAAAATSTEVTGLLPATSYDFRVVPRSADNAYAGNASTVVTGTTATPGFTLISDCQDLQNINNDLTGYYELSRNIDCAETATWNGGSGFDPIGNFDFANLGATQLFVGIFKGNNYTISNIYSDQTTNSLTACGLFSTLHNNAIIQDVKLDNLTCLSNSVTGSLAASVAGNSSITNIHVTNASIGGPSGIAAGGLAAIINTTDSGNTASVTKSSFQGTITATSPAYLGGFVGGIAGTANIHDNYSDAQITVPAATISGGFTGNLAIGAGSNVQHNYATGSLQITSSDDSLNPADPFGIIPDTSSLLGGFTGYIYNIDASNDILITENFTHMDLSSQSPENAQAGFATIAINGYTSAFDNYFDADLAGSTDCVHPGSPTQLSCTGVSGQPNYFKNNNTNAPLNTWDFTNIWMTTSELPVFGTKVTTGTTAIPPERLNPPVTTNPPAAGGATATPTTDNPVNAALVSGNTGGAANSVSAPTDETGVLGAIKHFVRNLPAVVVVGFPYALFLLLGIAALVLLVEFIRELRRLHILQALLRKQQLLAEERDAFWHLAANYLRAPITLIVGGAEALHDLSATSVTTHLQEVAADLQNSVAGIMKKIEGSTSLQAISQVHARRTTRIARRAIFIVPVVTVAFLALISNYVATSYRSLSPGVSGYLAQLAVFIIVTVLFYAVLNVLTQGKAKRQAAEDQLERQTNELANARHELIEDTAKQLNPDLTVLEGTLQQLPADQANLEPTNTLRDGTSRLREIVSSFAMLIKVQEGTEAISAAPEASTTDLTNILTRTRAKLTPQITAKGVRVMAPAIPLAVHAEADLANQVLESIISNAVDYSPANGTVKVEAKRLQDSIQLRVSDQGQGIDKKQLDHLFQPFVRADGKSAMDMSHGGFGINLYLDKLIMEQMGGSISANSTPGRGTEITMTWPA